MPRLSDLVIFLLWAGFSYALHFALNWLERPRDS